MDRPERLAPITNVRKQLSSLCRRKLVVFLTAARHTIIPELLKAAEHINTIIRYFHRNATFFVQPVDSFVIQKIKCALSVRWERFNTKITLSGNRVFFGKTLNPGKMYFFKLAELAIGSISRQRDVNGFLFAKRGKIRNGMVI